MALAKLELHVPAELLEALGPSSEIIEAKVLEQLVMGLVRDGKISIRYGADVLEVTYHNMLDLMAKHDVPLINYDDPAEIDQELKALEKFPK